MFRGDKKGSIEIKYQNTHFLQKRSNTRPTTIIIEDTVILVLDSIVHVTLRHVKRLLFQQTYLKTSNLVHKIILEMFEMKNFPLVDFSSFHHTQARTTSFSRHAFLSVFFV